MVRVTTLGLLAAAAVYGVVVPSWPGGAGVGQEKQSWYGTTTVYVGPYNWNQKYAPRSIYTGVSQQPMITADFPVVACDPDTDTCTAPCPGWRWCESSVSNSSTATEGWANLPAGTEVRFIAEVVVALRQINSGTPATAFSQYPHGLTTGDEVYICGITGLPCQTWTITVASTTSFTLDGSVLAATDYNGARAFIKGRELPQPLKSWEEQRFRSYYIVNPDGDAKTFQLAAEPGGEAIDITTAGETFGMSFAGYTQAISIPARSGQGIEFTCDAETDVCTAVGHGLSTNNNVQFYSTGTLPGGLRERWDRDYATYCMSVLDADTFQLKNHTTKNANCNARAIVDITSEGEGTHVIWNRASSSAVYLRSIEGYPQGTTFAYRGNGHRLAEAAHFTSSTTRPSTGGNQSLTIYAKVPAITAPGDYPITVTLSDSATAETNPVEVEFTLKAEELVPLSKKGPAVFPKPDTLSFLPTWELTYTSTDWWSAIGRGPTTDDYRNRCYGARDHIDNVNFRADFDSSNRTILHYDSAWHYVDAAVYYNDPTFLNCSWYIVRKIVDYIDGVAAQSYAQTWQRGFRPMFWHTREAGMRYEFMRYSEPFGTQGFITGTLNSGSQRELGLALDKHVERILFGGVDDVCTLARAGCTQEYGVVENAQAAMESVLWMIDETARERWYTGHQPVFQGLGMRALVHYYQNVHRDERIPVVIKRYLDAFWDAPWVNLTDNKQYYSPEPTGDRCDDGCQVWSSPTLNGPLVPAFWWIYRMTGDEDYLDRGDTLFDKFFNPASSGTWPYNVKELEEMNYWMFDGFKYRHGKKTAW